MTDIKKVVTRFAPSPTGFLHIGSARTALFNLLYARKYAGTFILRIEDTDRERSKREYEESILEGLRWLGITYDKLSRQSERTDIYREYLKKLIDSDSAYLSKEPATEGKRSEVIRLRNPGRVMTFDDEIRGEITFDTGELGDFVIAKSVDEPLYHLAVVVDDFLMEVTHIIRGEDHISNTPRQMLIAEALGIKHPIYAHLPLILAPDRSKLSKRHGAISVTEYYELGYLSGALINFLALLGWSPQGKNVGKEEEQEIFLLPDLIKKFELGKIGKSGAIFNTEKLDWINREHIKRLPEEKLFRHVSEAIPPRIHSLPEWGEDRFRKIIPILIERIVKFSDITEMSNAGELDFFFKAPEYKVKKLIWKKDADGKIIKASADELIKTIEKIPPTSFTKETIKSAVINFIGDKDRGSILWSTRYALSGLEKSPDPFIIASVIGKDATLNRLKIMQSHLSSK